MIFHHMDKGPPLMEKKLRMNSTMYPSHLNGVLIADSSFWSTRIRRVMGSIRCSWSAVTDDLCSAKLLVVSLLLNTK